MKPSCKWTGIADENGAGSKISITVENEVGVELSANYN